MRLFAAVNIPKELKEAFGEVQAGFRGHGKFSVVNPENIHITLKFLGEVPENNLGHLREALDKINFEPFKVKLSGVGAFPNHKFVKVVWAGVSDGNEEIQKLHQHVEQAISEFGFKKDKNFESHATLARAKFINNRNGMRDFFEKYENSEFGKFKVNSFELMESRLSPKGAEYSVVKSFS